MRRTGNTEAREGEMSKPGTAGGRVTGRMEEPTVKGTFRLDGAGRKFVPRGTA